MKPDPSTRLWAFSYLRFSTLAQAMGDSERRQLEALKAWLKRHPDVTLDQTLSLFDKGVSGFKGEHRKNPRHALARFQEYVDSGRVPAGSYLIVENLDRLTREHWSESIPYVLSLIAKGIRIVQLSPVEVVYHSEMEQGQLLMMLMELGRSHGESSRKADAVGKAWRQKKAAARDGTPHGRRCPDWIELIEGKYRLRPGVRQSMTRLFELSLQGLGAVRIKRELVSSSVPSWTAASWTRRRIVRLLCDRAVIGEYQPMRNEGKTRVPEGEPIQGYYPAAVDPELFHAARAAATARQGKTGRPGARGNPTSPFAGLLYSAIDGKRLVARRHDGKLVVHSAGAPESEKGSDWRRFSLDHLAAALRSQLSEVAASAIFADPGADQVAELQGRLSDVEERLAGAVARYDADPRNATWAGMIDKYDAEKRSLNSQLRDAMEASATPRSASWAEALELMNRENPVRLRQCLLQTVEKVWVLIVPREGQYRLAACQVRFVGGATREYLVASFVPLGWGARQKPGKWVARSLAAKIAGDFDMSNRAHAENLARLLMKLDLTDF